MVIPDFRTARAALNKPADISGASSATRRGAFDTGKLCLHELARLLLSSLVELLPASLSELIVQGCEK